MHTSKKYSDLAVYLDSGSSAQFFNQYAKSFFDMNVYAVSSTSDRQQAYCGYCTPDEIVQDKHIKTCLGDMFSSNLLEYIERVDEQNVTLGEMFTNVNISNSKSNATQKGKISL